MFSADSGRLDTTLHLDDDIYDVRSERRWPSSVPASARRSRGPPGAPPAPTPLRGPRLAASASLRRACRRLAPLGWTPLFAGRAGFRAGFRENQCHGGLPPQLPHVGHRVRQPTMARQASLEVSGGSSSATAASNSWTAITLDAVRTREGPRPRDPTEQARLPAGVGGVAQLVPRVVDVLANAHLDVDWYESTQIWRCIILGLRGRCGVRVIHENPSDMARYSRYSIAMSRYERQVLENS